MALDSTRASFRNISLGFLAVILIGAILLWLPIASHDDGSANFLDCLFTATSATCVTGLIVQDTGLHWTVFGQIVILLLIQLGGMGVLTVALTFTKLSGRNIDLSLRTTMQDSISAPKMGGIVRLTSFIIRGVLLIELLGASILSLAFCPLFGIKGIWMALFHSISAFCNAGFDIMGPYSGQFSSLSRFVGDSLMNATICLLIVVGGLGFLTWKDICEHKLRLNKYTMQSKIILTYTSLLIVLPFIYLLAFENTQLPLAERLWSSLFQTITLRTAGFNTVDFNTYSENARFLMIVLMLIGGSPGSTAGGIKTTTLAVFFATAISVYRRQEFSQCFGRTISSDTIRQASAILSLYLILVSTSAMFISHLENLPLMTCIFETTSAIATVGVTMGITPQLSWASKFILILLMFFGRVGGLTLIYATLKYNPNVNAKCPQGQLTVG